MFGDMSKYLCLIWSDGRGIMKRETKRELYIQTRVICKCPDTFIVREFAIRRRVAEGTAR